MVARILWDSNSNILKEALAHKRDWDAAYGTVQETIKSVGDVLATYEESPDTIHDVGLDIPIQTIENCVERLQEVQEEAQRILKIYDNNSIRGLSVKNVQSIAATSAEALTALVGIVSQVASNIGDASLTDRTATTALKWVAVAGYGSALAFSALKERLLRRWRANEEKAGKLRSLVDQADLIESIQGTCQILKEFRKAITPAKHMPEYEWQDILHKIKKVPRQFQEKINPKMLRVACVSSSNFQQLERRMRAEAESPEPASVAPGISPVRQKLLRAVDKIRAQQLAQPPTIPF